VATYAFAAGQPDHPTPTGRFTVTAITWNPWWYPPPFPWAARDTITPPCPDNPVGRVKLTLGGYLLIHGTPETRSIGHAASHGCLRLAPDDALALAAAIVAAVLPDSSRAADRHAADTATVTMRLPRPVPVTIRYDLAEVTGDSLRLYPDIYRRTPRTADRVALALRALAGAGIDTSRVDRRALAAAVARSRQSAVTLPLP